MASIMPSSVRSTASKLRAVCSSSTRTRALTERSPASIVRTRSVHSQTPAAATITSIAAVAPAPIQYIEEVLPGSGTVMR